MFSDENGAFRPQILTNALDVQLDGLDLDTVIQLKEENKSEELFKYLLLTMCNALKPVLTLFQPDDRGCAAFVNDYTWLLLPENLLREGISIRDLVTIFETLADYATTTHDTDVLTEYVRQKIAKAALPTRLKDLNLTVEQLSLPVEDIKAVNLINNLPRSMTTDDLFDFVKLAY